MAIHPLTLEVIQNSLAENQEEMHQVVQKIQMEGMTYWSSASEILFVKSKEFFHEDITLVGPTFVFLCCFPRQSSPHCTGG